MNANELNSRYWFSEYEKSKLWAHWYKACRCESLERMQKEGLEQAEARLDNAIETMVKEIESLQSRIVDIKHEKEIIRLFKETGKPYEID